MRIAVMTYSLAQQGRRYSVEDYITAIAASGAQGINWVGCCGRDPRELRQRSLDAGLEPSCFTFVLEKLCIKPGDWRQEARQAFEDAHTLGVHSVMAVPIPPKDVADMAENRRIWHGVIEEMLELSRQSGIVLTIENFQGKGSAFVTSDELAETGRRFPELRFTYDAGNAATGGEEADHGPQVLRGKIEYVHFKDYTRCQESDHPEDYRLLHGRDGGFYYPAVLGKGDLDLAASLKALRATGYDGWLDVEYEGAEPAAADGIAAGVRWFREHLDD